MNYTVAILIPVFNGLSFTKQCIRDILDSIARVEAGSQSFTLVVTDDGSTDGTADWIRENHQEIHVIQGNGSLWWSGSVNKGIEYALNTLHSTYVLLWNNDITPIRDYFKAVLQVISNPEKYPLACSMVYFKDKPDTLISTGGYFNSKNGRKGLNNYGIRESEALLQGLRIDWFGGMGTLIRHDVFGSVGLFDDVNFPQYHGDSDYGIRATRAGYNIELVPEMKIWNDAGNTGLHKSMGFRNFMQSFTSIKSNYNIRKDLLFYRMYTISPLAYVELVKKYFIYCASYCKWKMLSLFGIKKS